MVGLESLSAPSRFLSKGSHSSFAEDGPGSGVLLASTDGWLGFMLSTVLLAVFGPYLVKTSLAIL
jgi:hypothetical protein